jgi:hypothetical protein
MMPEIYRAFTELWQERRLDSQRVFLYKACYQGRKNSIWYSLQAYWNHEPAALAISFSVRTASSLETPSLRLIRPTP